MVSYCANTSCKAHFKFLHEGRLFQFLSDPEHAFSSQMEYWWLCSECCVSMVLVRESSGEIKVVPMRKSVVPIARHQVPARISSERTAIKSVAV